MRQILINMYENVKDKDRYSWDSEEWAGMYLSNYPEDPKSALRNDILNMRIPSVIGRQARSFLDCALRDQERVRI